MASTKIARTLASNSNSGKLTISCWVKRHSAGEQGICGSWYSGAYHGILYFSSTGTLNFYDYRNGYIFRKYTSGRFIDVGAWYHIVCNFDHTLGSPTGKIYVNGVEQALATDDNYSQGATSSWLTDYTFNVGTYSGSGNYFDGIIADFYFIQGYVYEAATFGETDATTGEWKPITDPTINYGGTGGNSCHLKFEDSSNMDLDSGSNNVSFTTTGTLTQTKDCPSHNFATLNTLVRTSGGAFSQGNNTFTDSSGSYQTCFSTIGMFNGQGKYYAEFKVVSGTSLLFGIADYKSAGVIDRIEDGETRYLGEYANSYGYQRNGNFYYNGNSTSTGYDSFTTNDIIGMAVDMDNLKIYWHKNGTYQNSKNPASNNGETIVAPDGAYHMAISVASSVANANFGNGIFGTSAISSAGTNASGHGSFEYDVPSGYTALSSKGLNV